MFILTVLFIIFTSSILRTGFPSRMSSSLTLSVKNISVSVIPVLTSVSTIVVTSAVCVVYVTVSSVTLKLYISSGFVSVVFCVGIGPGINAGFLFL